MQTTIPSGLLLNPLLILNGLFCISKGQNGNFFSSFLNFPTGINKLALYTTPEFIQYHGYPSETHNVVTEDGYILTIHRIPSGRITSRNSGRITSRNSGRITSRKNPVPVLVVHPLLSNSKDWLLNGPGKALGFALADEGYDVFLHNSRGNTYSRNHTTLNVDSDAFWQFSFHEMGVYDIPATIDYILNITSRKSLYYIGHSQGTTQFFIMGSERPEYTGKIKRQFSMAPVTFMGRSFNPFFQGFFKEDGGRAGAKAFTSLVGTRGFFTDPIPFALLANTFCYDGNFFQEFCAAFIFSIAGFNRKQLNATLLPILTGQTPAGASVKQILHYGQAVASKKFRQYDYGAEENKRVYGQEEPPDYDASKVRTNVTLFCGRNDWLCSLDDVKELVRSLNPALTKMFVVEDPEWNHLDFLWGIDSYKYVYSKIINTMNSD